MTRIDETNTDLGTIFTKTPPLNSLSFRDSVEEGSLRQVEITEREISICEILRAHPHPNICAYHGVSVKDNRVTGVCFERYALTLHDMVKKGLQFDADACLAAIEAGLDHLHSLNIIHCDIKPGNIFATPYPYPNPAPTSSFIPAYQFVIGDFDSAHVKGGELRLKSGTPGWMSKHAFNAHREVDFHGLSMVRWWLVGKGYGVPDAQTTYEKTAVILEVADMSYCHS
ncbi:hypothetical protein P154DRAFT_448187 [Amniculicola lignicola CBS 123094]|uniref:Protein kinase domain-containing protein n=1 Tax=Amniculicola lignicola CBS 123094 TaxID=1392246 RepID=A0A6A5VYW7_9PLEO|nr:hypothetical protein P154DRAFT_448187 [Amniculicola lignicola CBS 123094]